MRNLGNRGLSNESCATFEAVFTLALSFFNASWSNRGNYTLIVSGRWNNFLFNKSFITCCTLFTISKTGCCTSGFNTLNNFFCMTISSNCGLRNENFVTNRAVRAFCKTGFGTSRSNCFISYCIIFTVCYRLIAVFTVMRTCCSCMLTHISVTNITLMVLIGICAIRHCFFAPITLMIVWRKVYTMRILNAANVTVVILVCVIAF